jgi:hypothetical protein
MFWINVYAMWPACLLLNQRRCLQCQVRVLLSLQTCY